MSKSTIMIGVGVVALVGAGLAYLGKRMGASKGGSANGARPLGDWGPVDWTAWNAEKARQAAARGQQ